MKICLCACLLLVSFQSYAQQMDERLLYAEKVEKYKRMKNVGAVLAVAGSIALIVAVAAVSEDDYSNYYLNPDEDDHKIETAAIVGVSALSLGVPLWIVGAHHQNKYKRKLNDISIGVHINSQSRGLILSYRF
jgi:hypothetical protein